ncbi:MAG: hypothetical protein WAL15_08915, partial [Xanthobacteraceae bacterium]
MKPLALLMWLGIVTTAAAQTEHEEMIFRGVGAVTCAEFARQYSVRPDFAELMFLTWAEGYMSARNDLLFTDRKDLIVSRRARAPAKALGASCLALWTVAIAVAAT